MIKYIFTVLVACFTATGYAQVTNQGKPASWRQQDLPVLEAYVMPQFDLKALQEEDKINDANKEKPYRFGYEFFVDHTLDNSGVWTTLPNGDRVWRMRYYSEGAYTLNFLFTDFYMPKGATLYLYNNDKTDLLGAYDEKQNNKERVLGTWLVQGSDIWIEYYEPAAVTGQGKLEIFKVVHGYRTVSMLNEKDPDSGLNHSGDCNYDAECYIEGIDNLKNISKKSTALIIVNNSNWCTGSLINNTNNDGTPYFLTANHCYSDPSQWAFMFNWISPNPVCGAGEDSANNAPFYHLTASGSEVRARRHESDFMLLEMNNPLPEDWDVVWAGWDRGLSAPAFSYSLHHPSGDIMKLAYDADPAFSFDHEDGMFTWEVNWELGITEGGSSGSPLFDDHGRIRGQLLGGTSGCNGNESNGGGDGYGRLNKSWNEGQTPDTRLKDWLDPGNTGAETTDAYPPQEIYAIDAKVILFDAGHELCNAYASPSVRIINYGAETLTSVQVSYALNGNEPQFLNWTGSLATNQSTILDLPLINGQQGANFVMIELLNPNGEEDENNIDNSVTVSFMVYNAYEPQNITLNLLTDNYAEEISWELTNSAGEVLYSVEEDTYANAQQYSQVFDLNAGCYTFVIHDGYGDGICCGQGQGYFSLTTLGGDIVGEGSDFGSSKSITFRLGDVMAVNNPLAGTALAIYPNPSSGLFTVTANTSLAGQEYTVYNMLGQAVKSGQFAEGVITVDLNTVANGVYILKINDIAATKTTGFKLIKE